MNRYYDHGLPPIAPSLSAAWASASRGVSGGVNTGTGGGGACSHGRGPDCTHCAQRNLTNVATVAASASRNKDVAVNSGRTTAATAAAAPAAPAAAAAAAAAPDGGGGATVGKCSHGQGPDCVACAAGRGTSRLAAPSVAAPLAVAGRNSARPDTATSGASAGLSRSGGAGAAAVESGLFDGGGMLFLGQRVIVGVCTVKNASCIAGEAIEVRVSH